MSQYDPLQVNAFIEFEIAYLDKIKKLEDSDYLDVKYSALCSTIEHLGNYIYRNSDVSNQRQGSKARFIKLLTEYYSGDEFKYITHYYINDILNGLIGQDPRHPYLIINGKNYYEKLSNNMELFEKIKSIISKNGDRMKIEKLEEELMNDDTIDRNKISKYLKLLTTANCLYHFGRCSLAHERVAPILSYKVQIGHVGYKFSEIERSCLTFDVIDKAIRKILDTWKSQLINNELYTFNYPGNDNL